METIVIILLVLALVSAISFVVFSNGQRGLLSLSLKSVSSFLFTFLGLAICYTLGLSLPAVFMVMGLVASCFGDVILGLPDMPEMNHKATTLTLIGGLSFAVAHICYLVGMIMLFGFAWWVILVAIALGLIFFFGNKFIFKLDYGKLTYGMPFYSIFVSLVVAESIMTFVSGANIYGSLMLLFGFVLFWLSDIILMVIYFGNNKSRNTFYYYFNLGFYYAGQILIASSLMFLL